MLSRSMRQKEEIAYPKTGVVVRICASSLFEDGIDQVIKVVVGIGIIEAFGETVDEDTRIWGLNINLRIRTVVVFDGKEDIASGLVGIVAKGAILACTRLIHIVNKMITDHRVNLDFPQESSLGFDNAEK